MFPAELVAEASRLIGRCTRDGLTIATAESCTGGLVFGLLTEVAGSSLVMDRGFVTYSNAAKTAMLGVDAAVIARDGAVSASVARAMAEGALTHSDARLAVAITGIAGPGGGSAEKPVGLVQFAALCRGHAPLMLEARYGPLARGDIRLRAVGDALRLLGEAAALAGKSV